MREVAQRFYLIVVIARDVCRFSLRERMMYGFLLLAFLFILMANVPFMVNDPQAFEGQTAEEAALQIGFVAINIFTLLIAVFVSLGTLQNFLSRERLVFLLSKPVRRWQIMEGVILGLSEMVFLNWCLMAAGMWLVMLSQTRAPVFYIFSGMGVTLLLGLVYVALVTFFFTLIPNAVAGVFAIFVLIAAFGASLAEHVLFQKMAQPFLKSAVAFGLNLLPPVNVLLGLSMRQLRLFDIDVRAWPVLGHTLLVLAGLNFFSCLKFRRFGRG